MSRASRQPPGQPVVWQAHRRGRVGVRGLLVGEPAQLGHRDRRRRARPRSAWPTRQAHPARRRARWRRHSIGCRSTARHLARRGRRHRGRPSRAADRPPTPPRRRRGRRPLRSPSGLRPTTVRGRPRCRRDAVRTPSAPSRRCRRRTPRPCTTASTSRFLRREPRPTSQTLGGLPGPSSVVRSYSGERACRRDGSDCVDRRADPRRRRRPAANADCAAEPTGGGLRLPESHRGGRRVPGHSSRLGRIRAAGPPDRCKSSQRACGRTGLDRIHHQVGDGRRPAHPPTRRHRVTDARRPDPDGGDDAFVRRRRRRHPVGAVLGSRSPGLQRGLSLGTA